MNGTLSTARLQTARLTLRVAQPADAPALADYYRRNREHLSHAGSPMPASMFQDDGVADRLRERAAQMRDGTALAWLLSPQEETQRVIGTITFDQIHRRGFQSCMLGYGIDAQHEGRGLMTEALRAAIDHAFDVLRLHRVQANHLPDNARSAAVLRRLGFVREGLAPQYLFIGGAWRDHVLNALINPRFDNRWLDTP